MSIQKISIVGLCLLPMFAMAANRMEARVTTYHRLAVPIAGQTVAVVPSKDQENSLEWDTLAQKIANELTAAGAQIVPADQAKYFLVFSYHMGAQGSRTINMPMIGQTGVGGASTYGTVSGNARSATISTNTVYTPTFGVTGSIPIEIAQNERLLAIDLFDSDETRAGGAKPVYQAKISSVGRCDDVALVVPYMVIAAFQDFPGQSGVPRKATVPVPKEIKKSCQR